MTATVAPSLPPAPSARPADITPSAYVLHYSTSHCTSCGTESHESKFFALSFLRSRDAGKQVRHLVPCDRPRYNLPIERIKTAAVSTPFCCACPRIDLSHLPPPPSAERLNVLAEVAPRGASAPSTPPRSSKPATRLEDLA